MTNGKIDSHHHIVWDKYVRTLEEDGIVPAHGAGYPKWSLEKSLEIMDQMNLLNLVKYSDKCATPWYNPIVWEREGKRKFSGHGEISKAWNCGEDAPRGCSKLARDRLRCPITRGGAMPLR